MVKRGRAILKLGISVCEQTASGLDIRAVGVVEALHDKRHSIMVGSERCMKERICRLQARRCWVLFQDLPEGGDCIMYRLQVIATSGDDVGATIGGSLSNDTLKAMQFSQDGNSVGWR